MHISRYFLFLFSLSLLFACGKDTDKAKDKNTTEAKMDSLSPQKYLQSLTKQIEMNPTNYGTLNERSQAYYHLDSMEKAMKDIEKSLAINDSVAETHYLKGFYSAIMKDTTLAISELERALNIGSMDGEISYQLAQILLVKNRMTEAGKWFDLAMRLDSIQPQYIFGKGLWFEKQKNYKEAIKFYTYSIKKDSLFAKPYIQLHNLYQSQYHSDEEAAKWLSALLRKQPNHALGNYHRGNDLFQKAMRSKNVVKKELFEKDMEEVISYFTRSIGSDPLFAQANYERGYCYFVLEKHEEAMKDFEATIKKNPNHSPAHFMLGSYFEHYEDKTSALEHYKKALALNPNFKEAAKAVADLSQQK